MVTPENPYRPPTAAVSDVALPGDDSGFGPPGATVAAGRGAGWIGEGWALFKAAPLLWIVATVLLGALWYVLNQIPLLGNLASALLQPVFMAGVLAFAHGIARGESADIGRLFAGFRERMGGLVAVGALYLALFLALVLVAVVAVALLLGGLDLANVADPVSLRHQLGSRAGLGLLALLLVMLGLMVPIAAAYWFAPGLVFYAGLDPAGAMKESLVTCLRNWLPFLVYGLLGLLLLGLGALPLGLGLLVVMPVLMASYYSSFRDLYGRRP